MRKKYNKYYSDTNFNDFFNIYNINFKKLINDENNTIKNIAIENRNIQALYMM